MIAQSFAEIFFGNCTTLGIPCAIASAEVVNALHAAIEADPKTPITLDVDARQVRCGDATYPVTIPDSSRGALLAGKWDPIGDLLEGNDAIEATAAACLT